MLWCAISENRKVLIKKKKKKGLGTSVRKRVAELWRMFVSGSARRHWESYLRLINWTSEKVSTWVAPADPLTEVVSHLCLFCIRYMLVSCNLTLFCFLASCQPQFLRNHWLHSGTLTRIHSFCSINIELPIWQASCAFIPCDHCFRACSNIWNQSLNSLFLVCC